MDIVKFPVLQAGSSVAEALKVMRAARISGVVVPHDNNVSLINYGELIIRGVPKRTRLGELEAVRIAPIIPSAYVKRLRLPLKAIQMIAPHRITNVQRQRVERFMHAYGYSFAVMGPMRTNATVVTLSEDGGRIYNVAPQDCYCTNSFRPHPYGLNHPDICPLDGARIKCY